MVDYNGIIEVGTVESEMLNRIYGIPYDSIVLFASVDVIRYIMEQHGEVLTHNASSYSATIKGYYRGLEITGVPGENFFRPVVLYDRIVHNLPDKTLILAKGHYAETKTSFANKIGIIRRYEGGMTADYDHPDLFYNSDPIELEDTKPYDNTAITAFFAAAREREADDAD